MTRDAREWGAIEWCVRWSAIMGLTALAFCSIVCEAILTGVAAPPVLAAAACHRITMWLVRELDRVWGLEGE